MSFEAYPEQRGLGSCAPRLRRSGAAVPAFLAVAGTCFLLYAERAEAQGPRFLGTFLGKDGELPVDDQGELEVGEPVRVASMSDLIAAASSSHAEEEVASLRKELASQRTKVQQLEAKAAAEEQEAESAFKQETPVPAAPALEAKAAAEEQENESALKQESPAPAAPALEAEHAGSETEVEVEGEDEESMERQPEEEAATERQPEEEPAEQQAAEEPIPDSLWRQPPSEEEEQVEAEQPRPPPPPAPAPVSAVPSPPPPEIVVKAGGSEIRVQIGPSAASATVATAAPQAAAPEESVLAGELSGTESFQLGATFEEGLAPPPSPPPSPPPAPPAAGVDAEGTGQLEQALASPADAAAPPSASAAQVPGESSITVKAGGQEIIVKIPSQAVPPASIVEASAEAPADTPAAPPLADVREAADPSPPASFDAEDEYRAGSTDREVRSNSTVLENPAPVQPDVLLPSLGTQITVAQPNATVAELAPSQGTQITVKAGGQSITIEVIGGDAKAADVVPVAAAVANVAPVAPQEAVAEQPVAITASGEERKEEGEEESGDDAPATQAPDNGQPDWLNAPLSSLSATEQPAEDKIAEVATSVGEGDAETFTTAVPEMPAAREEQVEQAPAPTEAPAEVLELEEPAAPAVTDDYANLAFRAR